MILFRGSPMNKRKSILYSLVLFVLVALTVGARSASQRDVASMTRAAESFLGTLSDEQRAAATFELDSEERSRFHFIPIEMFERGGVMIADLSELQRERAHLLLKAGLSQRGYLTAAQVMELEDVLQAMEGGGRFARDRDEYLFTFFGTPASGATWGWRFEGHHISLHFTIVGGAVAVASPAFVGANPAEVREGPQRGRRVLGDREDAGRALIRALDDGQRRAAIIAVEAPRDILTGNAPTVDPMEPAGIEASQLDAPQLELLLALTDAYLGMMSDDIAEHRRQALLQAGTGAIRFAWAGSTEPGEAHYYRVQGPTFLIEYDNTQNDANHIHSVWRDFDGDFGRDLLREHRSEHRHD
jgi:hypothetical protein